MRKLIIFLIVFTWIWSSCHTPYSGTPSLTTYYEPGTFMFSATDSSIIGEILPYKLELNKVMEEVLVSSSEFMEKGKPESKLGNFVADACMNIASIKYVSTSGKMIDFCLLNNGGLRSTLPTGEITRKNVYELMPFENELVVLTLPGSSVLKILKYISNTGGVPVSNLRMKITGESFSEVFIGGQPFDSSGTYKMVTSDYLANGGDSMEVLSENLLQEPLNIKVRDAIIEYMVSINSRQESLKPVLDGRISK
jgi:2',3'-cyclic-nucleotide 2'-phosphodiesterase (5'-nucleotidase family)